MRCDEVMTREVEVVHPGESVREAARAMRDCNIGFLPVCRSDGGVIGTLTDRDIVLRVLAEGLPAQTVVEEVMSPDVIACRPSDNLVRAEELMRANQVSRIVCVDEDGTVAGVISLSDVAQYERESRAGELLADVTEREFQSH